MSELSRNELYQRTRDDLLNRQLSNNENLDRSILTLSSAALALSVTFLNGVGTSHCFPLLVIAWVGFVLAIVITIVSYLTSQRGITRQLQLAERYYLKSDDSALMEKNVAAEWTDRCAKASAVFFVLAIVFLLTYFAVNFPNKSETKEMAKGSGRVDNAAAIPSLQKAEAGASIPSMQLAPTVERGASVPTIQPAQTAPTQGTQSGNGDRTSNK